MVFINNLDVFSETPPPTTLTLSHSSVSLLNQHKHSHLCVLSYLQGSRSFLIYRTHGAYSLFLDAI